MTDLQRVRKDLAAERARRKEKIQALDDYVGFMIAKLLGTLLSTAGGLEALDPSFFPGAVEHPGVVFGAGVGLLIGPKGLKMLGKLLQTLSEGS
jgi:hypothetical protein